MIEMYKNSHRVPNIARHLNVKLSTAYRIISKYKKIGSVKNVKRKRKGKISDDLLMFISQFIDANRFVHYLINNKYCFKIT